MPHIQLISYLCQSALWISDPHIVSYTPELIHTLNGFFWTI